MGNPIVIDDGGSTRIKKIEGAGGPGKMDDLIDVTPGIGPPATAGSSGSQHVAHGSYSQIMIVYQDSTGTAITIPVQPFTSFEINSGLGQSIIGQVVAGGPAGGPLLLTVFGTPGVDPLVEARQHRNQRRYVIANAGAIERISVTAVAGGVSNQVFPVAGVKAIYTSVVIT
jgi:hypothetical protein